MNSSEYRPKQPKTPQPTGKILRLCFGILFIIHFVPFPQDNVPCYKSYCSQRLVAVCRANTKKRFGSPKHMHILKQTMNRSIQERHRSVWEWLNRSGRSQQVAAILRTFQATQITYQRHVQHTHIIYKHNYSAVLIYPTLHIFECIKRASYSTLDTPA